MMVVDKECKCEKVLEILKETRDGIKEEYSKYKIVNADFVRAKKAMFFEKINCLFKDVEEMKEVS